MKILYLCADGGIPVLGQKGASIHVREMIAAFARAGHQVILAAQVLNKTPWERPALVDATVIHVKPSSNAAAAVGALKEFHEKIGRESSLASEMRRVLFNKELETDLKKRFESGAPDFIYERGSLFGTAGITLARELNVPLLLELNAPLAIEQSAYRANGLGDLAAEAEKWTVRNADAVLSVSEPLRKHVIALGAESGRVHVVPNGIDPGVFQPGAPEPAVGARWQLNDGPVLGFVGGLRPWHGVERLPALLSTLSRRHKHLRMAIVGDGPLRSDLEREFKARKLEERVVMTGAVPHEQIPSLIRHFTVALAPYPKLNHDFYFSPLKLFEYMGCGIPVVASNCGQIAQLIRNRKTGLLCTAGNGAALAAACDLLLKDAKLRVRIGQAAAKLVHTHYTWDHNARRAAEIAEHLIQNRRKKA
jgi:glycosyltransferase involved in cell wall biosynthesis